MQSEQDDYPLTQDQIKKFQNKGYIKLQQVLPSQQIREFRSIMVEAVEKKEREGDKQNRIDDYSSIFTQVTNLWQIEPKTQSFVLNKRLAIIAKQLMGVQGVRLYHDQALIKNPSASKTPWHEDSFYWPMDSSNTVTMWMPMHDCPRNQGTMKFVSGSHKATHIKRMPISEDSQAYFTQQIEKSDLEVDTFDLNLGDATFHYGGTLHCAHGNTLPTRREVMTIIYMEDGVRTVPSEKMNNFKEVDLSVFCPGITVGQKIESHLNPLLA